MLPILLANLLTLPLLIPTSSNAFEETITWTSDADAIRYVLQASYDQGSSWQTIDSNVPTATYTVDVREESTVLLRIMTCYSFGCDLKPDSGIWLIAGDEGSEDIIPAE